jgi:hypothetical protein
MKVNMNKPFVGFDGKVLKITDQTTNELRTIFVSETLAQTMFNASTLQNAPMSQENKFAAFKICQKIIQNPSCVELTSEEIVLIKAIAAQDMSAGAYGQVVELLEQTDSQ